VVSSPRPGAGRTDSEATLTDLTRAEQGLRRSLSRAQVVMIGLGGAIGTGLFAGSGLAIGYAGPAVILSYLIAAVVAVVMVLSLSEMAVAHPAAGSFGVYAETYLGPWAGFVVRYTYWMATVVAVGGDAVAVGVFMQYWFPGTPLWLWSVGFSAALVFVNSWSVASFGTFEYWFASIKVMAIVGFILLGLAGICGWGQAPIGLANLTGLPGGFLPHGLGGVWMGVIMGLFSFYGIEMIAITSGEMATPERTIPVALRTMAVRLVLFYVLALFVVVAFVPWTQVGSTTLAGSPFVRVLAHSGVWHAAGLMNFVVVTAALSAINTNLYMCSRMLFSLSRGGYAPPLFGRLSASGSPVAGIALSGTGLLVMAGLSRFTPKAYEYLFGISLFGALSVWIIILASHFAFRRAHRGQPLAVRTPFFPYAQLLAIALMGGVLVTMAFDADWRAAWLAGVPWLLVVSAAYLLWRRRHAARAR
jgi:L-asparagine transporter-like permease